MKRGQPERSGLGGAESVEKNGRLDPEGERSTKDTKRHEGGRSGDIIGFGARRVRAFRSLVTGVL